jgi:choline-sulfatase
MLAHGMTRAVCIVTLALATAGCSRGRRAPPPPKPIASPPQPAVHDAGPPAPQPPFDVVLITIDSLRADMPWAGYPRDIAPRLTALAKRAIVYTHAYSISSFTARSLAGLMAGKYPSELRRNGVFFTHYSDENQMLCESLAEQSIPCVAGMAHMYFRRGFSNIGQGFEKWELVPGISFVSTTDPFITSQKMVPLAEKQLSDPDTVKGRFFAWYHFMDPHDEYHHHPDGPRWGDSARDRYDEEVHYTDSYVGELIDWIEARPWGKRTVIIISADHGEAFGEHGCHRHAFQLYEPLVHVPLIFVVPGQKPRTIDVPRSEIDLTPTIAGLLGAKGPPDMDGTSMVPELLGGPIAPARDVICDLTQDDFNARHRSILHDGWKLIAFGDDVRYELYHVSVDPQELHDEFWKDREEAKAMVALYKAASKRIPERPPIGGIPEHHEGDAGADAAVVAASLSSELPSPRPLPR